jgi:hypothetical protein
MRVRNRPGVGRWPTIRIHKSGKVSLSARVITPARWIWWKRFLRLIAWLAKMTIVACIFSLLLPEVILIERAPHLLCGAIVVFLIAKKRLPELGRILFGRTTVIEFCSKNKEVILYQNKGWSWPLRIKRADLAVGADLQVMDEAQEEQARARVLAKPDQKEDLRASAYSSSSWVTLLVGNNAQRIVSVFGHHGKLMVAAILNADKILEELTEEKAQEQTASTSAAE